jgi:Ribosome-associated heat shock protein implicated in the recycling of the 50S subunit (S4 paralog)
VARESNTRIDKWLWAIRVFKTRTEAADACRKGWVKVNGVVVKPSRDLKLNDVVSIRKSPVVYSFRVLAIVGNRQPAKLVENFAENLTLPEELEKLTMNSITITLQRDRGTGRPTKKDRRDIDKLTNDSED